MNAVFQRFINTVFETLIRKLFVLVYMDALIIPSSDEKENLLKLETVFKVAKKNGVILKRKQSGDSQKFPMLKDVKQIQSFLGLTGFFRKFIPGYALIAKPLSELTKKRRSFPISRRTT